MLPTPATFSLVSYVVFFTLVMIRLLNIMQSRPGLNPAGLVLDLRMTVEPPSAMQSFEGQVISLLLPRLIPPIGEHQIYPFTGTPASLWASGWNTS